MKTFSVSIIIWTDQNTLDELSRSTLSEGVLLGKVYFYAFNLNLPALFCPNTQLLCSQMTCISRPTRPPQPLGNQLTCLHASLLFPRKDEGRVSPSLLHLLCSCCRSWLFLGHATKCLEISVWDSQMEVPTLP